MILTLLIASALGLSPLALTTDDLAIVFTGNKSINTPRLKSELKPWIEDLEANPLDEGAAEDLAFEMEQIYRHIGRPDCKVEVAPAALEGDGWKITFRIDEGPQRILDSLHFGGNKIFNEERLARRFGWNEDGFLALFGSGRVVYSDEVLEAGLVGIKLLYRLAGYLDVVVTSQVSETPKSQRIEVDVYVQITEGPCYVLESVEFREEKWESLSEQCGLELGAIFTPRTPLELEKRLERHLAEQGYFQCNVTVDAGVSGSAGMRLRVAVEPGEIASIGEIEVIGAPHTRTSWIRSYLTFKSGDRYQKSALEDSRRELLHTGLFQTVKIGWRRADRNGEAVLDVSVELDEKDRTRAALRLGFGSYELGRVGAEFFHRNIFGTAVEGRASGKASF